MRYYPICLNLENKSCLVVGAGAVGKRKIQSLLDAGAAHITILDKYLPASAIQNLIQYDNVDFFPREFSDDDLTGKFIVIACTSNCAINQHISNKCNQNGILCNVVDQPEESSFIVPATITHEDLTIAISTAGKSPAMAKRIRKELQSLFGEEYGPMLTVMGRIRPLLLSLNMPTAENTYILRSIANSALLETFKTHDLDAAAEILKSFLPKRIHVNIPELLDGLV